MESIKSGFNYVYDGFCEFIEQENRLTEVGKLSTKLIKKI